MTPAVVSAQSASAAGWEGEAFLNQSDSAEAEGALLRMERRWEPWKEFKGEGRWRRGVLGWLWAMLAGCSGGESSPLGGSAPSLARSYLRR